MGALIRSLFLLTVLAFFGSLAMHRVTGDAVWRRRAMDILKWGVVLGLLGFGAVILRRAAVFV
ncbi:MAG TPA: hypothetical protein VFW84_06850 [Aquabacterium sp.]|uniref:hypothetical protein n=1 Tax=Aquabacterium sp. TaxID=1872578 RepID=UPI002D9E5383|nr:hypothetical protein [Aquabacterium sp.]HET6787503.1 hypothetical protein [Aquabacterium sp.]HET6787773.1 hypothetical protein [Aquabacterium sp.]HEX5372437.1 hypothetical protein [Aquabacterium sp.]